MNRVLFEIFGVLVTAWKLVGYAGVFLFSSRWLPQLFASRKAHKPVVPRIFWVMSMIGSIMCLAYFVWGKNDSVGILAYLFPFFVSSYNLFLELRNGKSSQTVQ